MHLKKSVKGYKKIFSNVHVDVSFVNASDEINIESFKSWRPKIIMMLFYYGKKW